MKISYLYGFTKTFASVHVSCYLGMYVCILSTPRYQLTRRDVNVLVDPSKSMIQSQNKNIFEKKKPASVQYLMSKMLKLLYKIKVHIK